MFEVAIDGCAEWVRICTCHEVTGVEVVRGKYSVRVCYDVGLERLMWCTAVPNEHFVVFERFIKSTVARIVH